MRPVLLVARLRHRSGGSCGPCSRCFARLVTSRRFFFGSASPSLPLLRLAFRLGSASPSLPLLRSAFMLDLASPLLGWGCGPISFCFAWLLLRDFFLVSLYCYRLKMNLLNVRKMLGWLNGKFKKKSSE